jgi:DNA-binding MarR family transcriptional regulator
MIVRFATLDTRLIVAFVQAKVASASGLSEALAAVWAHLNKRSSSELFRVVDELGSSFSQVKMLFLLEDGGEHSVKEIAAHLGLSLPAASRAVDGLVERGFVTRRESAEDRRSRLIALSDYGREVVDRLTRARLATLDTFVSEITPDERNDLLTALLPIVERIKSSD